MQGGWALHPPSSCLWFLRPGRASSAKGDKAGVSVVGPKRQQVCEDPEGPVLVGIWGKSPGTPMSRSYWQASITNFIKIQCAY